MQKSTTLLRAVLWSGCFPSLSVGVCKSERPGTVALAEPQIFGRFNGAVHCISPLPTTP